MHENIKKLEELTANLPLLTDLASAIKQNVMEYEVDGGTCIGLGLFYSEDVAVQKATATEGVIFPRHTHAEHEFIILVKGKMVNDDGRKFIGPDVIQLKPNESHKHTFLTECLMIGVTVPASPGYPHE
jgi:anti-sigma factor ChrR (cupin superfamily)